MQTGFALQNVYIHNQLLHCIKGNIRKIIIEALSGTTTCKCTNYSYINKVALHFFFNLRFNRTNFSLKMMPEVIINQHNFSIN